MCALVASTDPTRAAGRNVQQVLRKQYVHHVVTAVTAAVNAVSEAVGHILGQTVSHKRVDGMHFHQHI